MNHEALPTCRLHPQPAIYGRSTVDGSGDAEGCIYTRGGRCAVSWTADGVAAGQRAKATWLMIELAGLTAGTAAEWKQLVPKSTAIID